MPYFSTKRWGPISTGHRQWRDNGHCAWAHGYGRYVEVTFACHEPDERQWVMDFGGLREIKKQLEACWDHRLLLASDDPLLGDFLELQKKNGCNVYVMDVELGHGPGIEGSCKWFYDTFNPQIEMMTKGRVWISKVQIFEHENNSAMYVPSLKC